jgi:outer membrane protein assembly factor BamD (BamD/ComL family)
MHWTRCTIARALIAFSFAVSPGLLVAADPAAAKADPKVAQFEALAQAVTQNPAAAGEQQIVELATAARDLGRPYAANIAIKTWLARTQNPTPAAMLAAAENAALSGDLKTAASRYKLYLAAAPADETRSRAAARLYTLLIDDLGNADDAYTFMTRQGADLRQSAEARKYDFWFLEQAQNRRDAVSMASRLAAIMAEQLPLELERITCWDRLDGLMGELARATPNYFPAAADARKIVGLVRESPARAARYGFIVSWLEYRAGAAGKDPAALAKSFEPVVAAATAYVDAVPTAATLADVINVFVCPENNHNHWSTLGDPTRGWWTASFAKLSDEEKPKAINWQGWYAYQASPDQWIELGTKFPEVFKKAPATAGLPFLVNKPDPAVYTAQVPFLTGVASDGAKMANALAATKGTDLLAGLKHLSQQEAWHGTFESTYNAAASNVWPIWRSFPRQPAATDADWYKAFLAWAPEAIVRSPIAIFQPAAAQGYLNAAFAHGTPDPADKSAFVAALRSLDWVPWDEKTRREVIQPAHAAFKQWADQVRKQAAGPEKAKWAKAAAAIAPLEEEFKKAFDVNVSASADLAKQADPLAGQLARCVTAIKAKKLDDYLAAAREAYKLIRDYPDKKTPFGQPTLTWLLTNRPAAFDTIDFQREVIADQMAQWKPNSPTAALLAIDTAIVNGRPGWSWNNIPKKDRDQALAFNKTIGEGILAQLARSVYSNEFFARFRSTRRGSGWQEQQIGNEVLAKLIETKAFQTHKSRVGAHASATCDYQWLIRNEFHGLVKQFPVETFFDDMFVEDSKASGWFDWSFTQYSRDEKKKAANAAAERFATYASMATGPGNPLGYDQLPQLLVAGDRRDVYTARIPWEVWQWSDRALSADKPLRDKVVETAEAGWAKTRFDAWAMGRASIPGDPAIMQDKAKRADFFQKLAAYLERGKASRGRTGPPSLNAITQIPANGFSPDELNLLLSIFDGNTPATWSGGSGYEHLGLVLAQALPAQERLGDVARIAPELWRIGRDTRNADYLARLAAAAAAVAKAGQPDVAAAFADAGLDMLGAELPEAARTQLTALRTDAILALGGTNPVPRSDPRWPIYDAQLAFTAGKLQTAWDRYASSPAIVAQMYKELDPAFTTWLIRENTQTGNYDRGRELGQLMLAWVDATPGAVDAEAQAGLLVAYADIALARRDYPQARALYERIAAAKEFDGTAGKRDAELRVAEADRLARQFDAAKERLDRLTRRPDRILQTEANYQLALLKADQEEIEEAAGYLEKVFTLVPNHVGGRILEGKLNLLRRKYDVASKVKLGVLGDKKFLIPGKPLEVDLEDKNLAVVGKSTQIEIKAWTASGDEERFNLFPFGDSKTRFTGQIPTQLAAPVKGDHTLQVVGGDTVRYTFAESFGGSKGGLADEPAAMTVVTDSDFFVSSGAILSKEELENRKLEKLIRDKLRLNEGMEREMALAATRSEDQIKPGNRINVRVVDPDRSTSAAKDTLQVRAATASGDSLLVTLTETDAYSGVFEGSVPTGSSQATAYATDSTDGNDPNNTISPGAATPWIALADNKRPKTFSVDLNDNVAIGSMTVTAGVPGRKLKDVYVQTSLNGRDFRTLGQWRADGKATFKPWDASPRMDLVRIAPQPRPFAKVAEFEDYLGRGRFANGSPLLSETIKTLAFGPLDGNLGGRSGPLGLDGVTEWYVGHWYAGFEVPKNQTRTFTLEPKGKTQNVFYVFAIDGEISPQRDKPLTITRPLQKGGHRIDVYAYAYRHAGLNFEVLIDAAEPPFTASIPEKALSPVERPALADAFAVPPATIESAADNTKLTVGFAKDTRARVVRLLIADYETDAPAINSIALVDAEGKQVLPTQESFQDLAKNDVLEIIPGDRITVAYDDAAVITPAKQTQEQFLTATFTNAQVSAAFVEFKEVGGERRAEYIPMQRFKPGDTVKLFVNDPDMDVSDEPDRVSLAVKAGRGEPITIESLETEGHSGIFLGTVFPVAGKPERPSELTVAANDDLTLSYLDRENTDPGIPWERTSFVEQTGSDDPEVRVYDVASRPLDAKEQVAAAAKQQIARKLEERIPITREIVAVRPEKPAANGEPAKVLVDGPLLVEVLAPRLAQSPKSLAELFVQTESGREKLGRPVAEGEFPLDVPGTVRLRRYPGDQRAIETPPGVSQVVVRGNRYAADALGEGRFTFLVGKELGPVPAESLADVEYDPSGREPPPSVQVRGNDTVYVGCRYTDAAGQERWTIQPVTLTSDIIFDVMDRRYQDEITGTHVGDSLNLRLMHPALDVSDDKDSVTVKLTASGGGEMELPLTETFGHSGIFKGAVKLAYRDAAGEQAASAGDGRTLPVAYGETVTIRYAPASGEPIDRTVAIFKGGDAQLVPFTKQFKEPEIAVQTQFTVAEAWFELAKRHRELGQESLARREIAQGKKLLEEAIRDYPNTESRAQADYLLANLSFEFSKDSTNEEIARQHAIDAVTRFSDIVSSYPDSEYAPKSQYKKALVLEKLGQIDQACEEYVKLSYRYPDNELVAETIARLGQYFLSKGKEFDDAASNQTDPVEKEKIAIKGREMFTTAAQVFGRLGERFPAHALASKTKMLSAQCYLRAKDYDKSLDVFEAIYKDTKTDKDLAAEAMYWAGDVSLQKEDMKSAYRAFKKLTWDYPESKWAKFARGRLTEDAMVKAEAAMEKEGK